MISNSNLLSNALFVYKTQHICTIYFILIIEEKQIFEIEIKRSSIGFFLKGFKANCSQH